MKRILFVLSVVLLFWNARNAFSCDYLNDYYCPPPCSTLVEWTMQSKTRETYCIIDGEYHSCHVTAYWCFRIIECNGEIIYQLHYGYYSVEPECLSMFGGCLDEGDLFRETIETMVNGNRQIQLLMNVFTK